MRVRSWLAAAWALAVLGSATACGDSEDSEAPPFAGDPPPVLGQGLPPEVEHPATDAIERLQRAFVRNDYDGVCAGITDAAARQAGEAGHGDPSICERDLRRLFRMIGKGGGIRHAGKPRVIDVEADGSQAVATVALDRRWQARIPLTREDGRWRLSGMFGWSSGQARQISQSIADTEFPPAGRDPVEATDGDGKPCPDLSEERFPSVSGGCTIALAGRSGPLTMLTAFGDFKFDDCWIDYRVRVDSSGRTWTEEFEVVGGEKSVACGDVHPCYNISVAPLSPWRGRIYPDGDDAFLHRMDMCLTTCVGQFVGELNLRLVRDGDTWRADPVDGGGNSGFRFQRPLRVKGGLDIEA